MSSSSRWRLKPHDTLKVRALSHEAGISSILAQLLINRGIEEPARARRFLESRMNSLHDPANLPGAAEAADRIVRAIQAGKKIVIYGDYDVDGVCGTSVLWACLKLAGAKGVEYYIPHRVEEGYGVNSEALTRLATESRAEMIITVDCGISAVNEARLARELGVELIITDHHTIGPDLPEADVLVHPRLPGSEYPFGGLCGAAVAFKLAWQVCKSFGDGKKASPHLRDFLVKSLGLVALATIADLVPLDDENRVIVRHGLSGIQADPSIGLRHLMQVSGCLDKKRLNSGMVGFNIAPRINAAGRLERAMRAVEMLTTDDDELARLIANELDQCNANRQQIEQGIVAEARQMVEAMGGSTDRGALVLGKRGWHPGVIGIVASRLVETYHRPSIVVELGDELCQGSARSVPGFDLYEAIRACADGLIGFGGHAAAAGVKMNEPHFAVFAERFNEHCLAALTADQKQKTLRIDDEVSLATLTPKVIDEIEQLEPFGISNPRPLLMASNVRILGEPRTVGERKNHLQIKFLQDEVVVKAIAWNMADRAKALTANTVCSIVFQPSINEWNGRREVQLEIKDFAVSGENKVEVATASASLTAV